MRCQQLTLRIDPQFAQLDEHQLNAVIKDLDIFSFQSSLVAAKPPYWSILIFSYDHDQQPAAASAPPPPVRPTPAEPEQTLTAAQEEVYAQLRAWRLARAKAEAVPQYVVAHNASLRAIAQQHLELTTIDALTQIKQFGQRKAARYGAELLDVIAHGYHN